MITCETAAWLLIAACVAAFACGWVCAKLDKEGEE